MAEKLLPQVFRKDNPIQVNYDFTDIMESTGTVNYHGFSSQEQTTVSYNLSRNGLYSDNRRTSENIVAPAGFTKAIDVDFDTILNVPQIIKGKFMANVMFGCDNTTNTVMNVYAIVKLRKYSGTTETDIATMQSETITVNASVQHFKIACLKSNIASGVKFGVGDTLRCTVEIWGDPSASTDRAVSLYHDPKNRDPQTSGQDSLVYDTYLNFYIPFSLGGII